jgi:hypothetical protein
MEVETLVAWPILWEHGVALALVWAWVALAGFALLPWLRLHVGLAGIPLVGAVFWTVALYLLPFGHGLDAAAGLIMALAAAVCMRGAWRPAWKRLSWSTLILTLGSLPFLTTLLCQYVPFGMDGAMHATGATLIGRSAGLPTSHAPFAPDLPLPPMNLGVPALAGLAIRWGGEPAAAMLACHHLTFTLLILATYLLVRRWVDRTPAAVLAVVSVWTARASEASLEWGGFPTVLSVAIGTFAAHLLLQLSRSATWRVCLSAGVVIADIPIIHGCGAGTWLYCVAPWVVLATVLQSSDRLAALRRLAISALAATVVLAAYRAAGSIGLDADMLESTHNWQQSSAPLGDHAWLSAVDYTRKNAGSFLVLAGWGACAVLALRRQWLTALLIASAWAALTFVVANSRWWVLPASFLLYPERVLYWAGPISAATLAIAWRGLLVEWRAAKPISVPLAIALLALSGAYQNQFYQRIVREDFVNADGWEALLWAKTHLRPADDFVQTRYNSTGSFLPPIAQIGCTGAHHHHFLAQDVARMCRQRTVTHVLIDQALAPVAELPAGTVVFRNRTITILKVDSAAN